MRHLRLFLPVAVFALGLIFFWSQHSKSGEEAGAVPRLAPEVGVTEIAAELTAAPKAQESGAVEAGESLEAGARMVLDGGASEAKQQSQAANIPGRVDVVDGQGRLFEGESGTLELRIRNGNAHWNQTVQVELGRFEVGPPAAGFGDPKLLLVEAVSGRLGGRPVGARSHDEAGYGVQEFALDSSGGLLLHLCFLEEVLLEVAHAEDGRPVTDVRLVRIAEHKFNEPQLHPWHDLSGQRSVGASPVRLAVEAPAPAEQEWWFVGSPGAAWREIRIDRARGGVQRVELGPGADLEVEVVGNAPSAEFYLLLTGQITTGLRPRVGYLRLPMPASGGLTQLSGLPAGLMIASVQIGPWYEPKELLGRQELDLVSGQPNRLRFDLGLAQTAPKPWIRGRLLDINSTRSRVPRLEAHPLLAGKSSVYIRQGSEAGLIRTASLEADGPGGYVFEVQVDQPGTFVLVLLPSGFTHWIDVPAEGVEGLLLEPPAPLEIDIVCLDALTGQAFPTDKLHCWALAGNGTGTSRVELPLRARGKGRFELQCLPGELQFSTFEAQHALVENTIQVGLGEQRIELHFQAKGSVRLVTRLPDGSPGPNWSFDDLSAFGLEALEGQEGGYSLGFGGGEVIMSHGQGGRYRVRLPELPAYRIPENLEVILVPGEVTELVIELTPHG